VTTRFDGVETEGGCRCTDRAGLGLAAEVEERGWKTS